MGGSQGTSLILSTWQYFGPSTMFTGKKKNWVWTIFILFFLLKIDQLDLETCHGTQQSTWIYLDSLEVHKEQVWYFKVNRTWVCLHDSPVIGPGCGQTFCVFFLYFLKIDHLDRRTCQRTQQGTWTHRMSTAEMLAGTGSAYHVHREEDLALVKLFFHFFLISQNWPPRPRNLPVDPTGYLDTREVHMEHFWFFKVDRTWVHLLGSQGREPGSGQTFFLLLKIDHLDVGTCQGTR